jgi:hypothetical protein
VTGGTALVGCIWAAFTDVEGNWWTAAGSNC